MLARFTIIFVAAVLLTGCSATRSKSTQSNNRKAVASQGPFAQDNSPQLVNIDADELAEFNQKLGVVIGKTDFRGVLEANFVRLQLVNVQDPQKRFLLHIGESGNQTKYPWEVKSVKPGYFYLKLPVGTYRITTISIPVGSTTATEDSEIIFDVLADKVNYIGTLLINGTKEKIRLGGVPVIRPGFEYLVQIIDEREEGVTVFKKNFPNAPTDIEFDLMRLESLENPQEG